MKRKFTILMVLSGVLLAGCGNSSGAVDGQETPEKVHASVLLFKEERTGSQAVGTLSIQKEDGLTQVAENAAADSFVYDNASEHVLYLDENQTLYRYSGGENSEEIADEVSLMRFNSDAATECSIRRLTGPFM